MWLPLLACSKDPAPPPLEPVDRPADPAEAAVPVGVRTEALGDREVEVWYPAADAHRGDPGEPVDFTAWVPSAVTDVLGPLDLPPVPSVAVRDAELRNTGDALPVVIFSHGFGGTRTQSVSLATHWAGRGFVVVATDHAGRSMPDLLPCLFYPPLEGCDLEVLTDPGVADVEDLRAWLAEPPGWLDGALDPDAVALAGHSAGGGTTVTVGNAAAPPFTALLPMAGGDATTGDTPTLRLAGTCDGIVPASGSAAAHAASTPADVYVEVVGAGHLAFSDLCALDLGGVAEDVLLGRDDLNDVLVDQLVLLGTDGCAGAAPTVPDCGDPLPAEDAARALRASTAAFLEAALSGATPADPTAGYAELVAR
jgi:predicted dienelactone hydrolase